jgi:cohesin complex subunit SCC1
MLPEATTSKADATKMFFEILVLATKDAIKVEQPVDELGGPLRIRSKRGLWGSWAETGASGELASQSAPAASIEAVVEA